MCTSSLTVIPRDNLLKKIIPEKTKRIHTRDDAYSRDPHFRLATVARLAEYDNDAILFFIDDFYVSTNKTFPAR